MYSNDENWKSLFNDSTIVYTLTRTKAEEIAQELTSNFYTHTHKSSFY